MNDHIANCMPVESTDTTRDSHPASDKLFYVNQEAKSGASIIEAIDLQAIKVYLFYPCKSIADARKFEAMLIWSLQPSMNVRLTRHKGRHGA